MKKQLSLCIRLAIFGTLLIIHWIAPAAENSPPIRLICEQPVTARQNASNPPEFDEQLQHFRTEIAEKYRMDPADLDCVFSQVRRLDRVIDLIRPAPSGKRRNWSAYRSRMVTSSLIRKGNRFWNRHKNALERARRVYGVPPEIIVGILGIETRFGKNTGGFGVVSALSTLAFDYPEHPQRSARMRLFREELKNALLLSSKMKVNPLSLKGSYAGAIGLPQFLPGNILKYGVDFDGDGIVDLQNSVTDAIGSIAHFLVQHGWSKNTALVFPATLHSDCVPSDNTALNRGLKATIGKESLRSLCISSKAKLPSDTLFGLVDLENGAGKTEYWLATDNFFAITQYNRSYFYAMSVISLGRAIRSSLRYRPGT
ncbi:MAG: lytic murein transglycosylase B [Burkholderiaceae bacterium]|jgi:membrane-bound lytic murein transglycosylase B|nr:lytic murein transglycosylase B [Burkholderiaceae bacterium]